ncbi:MAG: 3'(2'),5'-bisphosphate nucleotidase CysQ [Gammaproteobacteria bacterium]|nr:3'(2'),5'-bisphosphate nucleotidase CysQ [Gammaproteobacteria bacterium]
MDIPEAALIDIVVAAGDAILEVYNSDFKVENKSDNSPLTQADLAAHEIIERGLQAVTPDIPIISEESEPPGYDVRRQWSEYWLVDPLDGTKEFVNRNGEFTVNIALISDGLPRFGIVGVPIQNKIYIGDVDRGIAKVIENGKSQPISGRHMSLNNDDFVIVASRSHGGERLEKYLDELENLMHPLSRRPVGSSLKLCVLAEGGADCYPRLGPTSEWDIGAAHAVLRAAGGEVYSFDKSVLPYNSKESLLNPEFVAVADASFDWWGLLPRLPSSTTK